MNDVPQQSYRKGDIVVIPERRNALWLAAGIIAACLALVKLAWALRGGAGWAERMPVAGLLAAGGTAIGLQVYRTVRRPRLESALR